MKGRDSKVRDRASGQAIVAAVGGRVALGGFVRSEYVVVLGVAAAATDHDSRWWRVLATSRSRFLENTHQLLDSDKSVALRTFFSLSIHIFFFLQSTKKAMQTALPTFSLSFLTKRA